ncbi:preprotein translocase subunit YajC [Actinoalloteichus hymeniacidonis]|uniref:Preprotein translocase, YajC subunit n=1 Tax=Actinoalloteichus hymeniacidonis TaxID=340345 RepID=A0AAC9HPD1_9PSEU|nr:preprotein translocase subunit YajC [Actinoalloteichus hymeniacidonis]AOS62919.1 preprotein translocase, YajC subunit [Actinoalloteichus hymeniacidonis]MBB5909048.1 preprotein translocase subunit YajC [Actinoalloteichus hymeniacidonis]
MESFIFPLLLLLLVLPLFLASRKQKRAMQEMQQLQNSLAPGDRVMTSSGLYGTVTDSSEDTIDVEIAPGVTTTWVRAAIRERVSPESEDTDVELPESLDESEGIEKSTGFDADETTAKTDDADEVSEVTSDADKATTSVGADAGKKS